PEDRRNVEEEDVPETHSPRQLFEWIGGAVRRLAHRVTSRAGINASCARKLCRDGSLEFSKSSHGPKKATRPSCKKTTVSASFFARCVSCVTTIEVRWNASFKRKIKSPICPAMMGSTMVVGS